MEWQNCPDDEGHRWEGQLHTAKFRRDHERNLRIIDHIVNNKVMDEAEIMATLRQAFTKAKEMSIGAKEMSERTSGISAICNLVTMGVMSDEELMKAFEMAFIKQVMEA